MDLSVSKLARFGNLLKSWRAGVAALVGLCLMVLYQGYRGQLNFFGRVAANSEFSELGGPRLLHYSPITATFLNSLWPMLAAGILLLLLALRLARTIERLSISLHDHNQPITDGNESGTQAVELVLLFLPLTLLLLMILQIALIVQAKFVVNYAAFCAARSAIVVIPDDFPGDGDSAPEPRNDLTGPDTSQKIELIQRAAALPLTAISPLPGWSVARGAPVVTNLQASKELLELLPPFNVGGFSPLKSTVLQVVQRAPYAYDPENTRVKVLTLQGAEGGNFKDHDWVTVKVSYRYYLTVPFAKKLFGTSYAGHPIANIFFGTDYYYEMVEQYTLPMDGEPAIP